MKLNPAKFLTMYELYDKVWMLTYAEDKLKFREETFKPGSKTRVGRSVDRVVSFLNQQI